MNLLEQKEKIFIHKDKRYVNSFHKLISRKHSYLEPLRYILKGKLGHLKPNMTPLNVFQLLAIEYIDLVRKLLVNEKKAVKIGDVLMLRIVQVDEGLPTFRYNIDYGGRSYMLCVSYLNVRLKDVLGDMVAYPVGKMAEELEEALKRGETFITFTEHAKKSSQLFKYDVHHTP